MFFKQIQIGLASHNPSFSHLCGDEFWHETGAKLANTKNLKEFANSSMAYF